MPNGRALITPPAFAPLQFGVLAAATDRSSDAPSHWSMGVTWESYCPTGSDVTYDPCLTVVRDDVDPTVVSSTAPEDAANKAQTTAYSLRGATPFAVYAEIDCSAPGFWERAQTLAEQAIVRSESRRVANVLATGNAVSQSGAIEIVFPHLQATEELVDDSGAILQTAADMLGTSAASPLDIVEAIGLLEQALGECYGGQGTIHVPTILEASLEAEHLTRRNGARLSSPLNHTYSISSGYPGDAPDGTATDDVAWVYATGALFYIRSAVQILDRVSSLDRSDNTVHSLVERRYVMSWDCCHFAVPVTTGGVIAGLPGQAGGV